MRKSGLALALRAGLLVCLTVLALAARPAEAAIVSVVNNGADGQPALISFHGAIGRGDFASFQRAADKIDRDAADKINGVPHITVELDSPGGDVVESVKIGRYIYQHFMMTVVRPRQECVSACVFILVAGAVHTPGAGAAIGVHKPMLVSWRNMDARQARAKYNELMVYLRHYFIQLGVSPAAYDLMMHTQSYSMHYFTAAEMDTLGLRGVDPAWEKLYGVKWAEGEAPDKAKLASAALPKIADIDESFRGLVMMPGAHLGELQTFFDPRLKVETFEWQLADEDVPVLQLGPTWPEIRQVLLGIWGLVATHLQHAWMLLALVVFEILRNRTPERPDLRDQWRRSF